MRVRTLLLAAFATGSLVLTTAVVGCGDTADTTPATTDAGNDATTAGDGPAEAKADTAQPIVCLDADITKLEVKDASLNDAGASTGLCAQCIGSHCGSELGGCQDDCDCREAVVGFFDCISTGKAITTCGAGLVTGGGAAQSLGLCAINSGCSSACGVPSDAGPDTSSPTDAGSDAPADAQGD